MIKYKEFTKKNRVFFSSVTKSTNNVEILQTIWIKQRFFQIMIRIRYAHRSRLLLLPIVQSRYYQKDE